MDLSPSWLELLWLNIYIGLGYRFVTNCTERSKVRSMQADLAVSSLMPRFDPRMRKNGLMNEIKFLGLVHTFTGIT